MRDFETDFDFDVFEEGIASLSMKSLREDTYPAMAFGPVASRRADPEREARILAHQERIQRELKEGVV